MELSLEPPVKQDLRNLGAPTSLSAVDKLPALPGGLRKSYQALAMQRLRKKYPESF